MWNGKKKAVTFSYDDGVTQDCRLVEMMNTYGVKGTFNLNSGMQSYANVWEHPKGLLIHRMNTEGLKELYQGHEIAAHCLTHADLPKYDEETIRNEILDDKKNLFGTYNDTVVDIARACGIRYSRTIERTGNFGLPEEPLTLKPTCHHNDADVMDLIDRFLASDSEEPQLFYLWGHSYEFDVDQNWDRMEEILKKLSGHDEIFYGTNREVLFGE